MTNSVFLPDLENFNWSGREVFIVYDSDIATKERVQEAEQRLCNVLTDRGAITCKVRLPDCAQNDKTGLDDYLLDHSDEEFEFLIDESEPEEPNYEPPKSLAEILKTEYPPTRWVWDNFILEGEVNLLYANGGVGKSMLALNLAIYCSLGQPFLGDTTKSTPVLILFAEDGEAEVSRRAKEIYASIKSVNTKPKILTGLINKKSKSSDDKLKERKSIHLWCNPIEGATLATISDTGEVIEEARLHNLRAELKKIGTPVLVVLDSLIDLFNMNEILRPPVNAAMKKILGGLCREYGCTVLVLAHPSKASMNDGSNYSGSTAFNNAVRQRLTLEVIKGQENLEMGAPKALKLTVAKSNYGSDACKEIWLSGCVMSPPIPETSQSIKFQRNIILREVMKNLDAGRRVVKNNGNHGGDAIAPKDLLETLKREKAIVISPKRLKEQLEKLEAKGLLSYVKSDKSKSVVGKATYVKGPNYKTSNGGKSRKIRRAAS